MWNCVSWVSPLIYFVNMEMGVCLVFSGNSVPRKTRGVDAYSSIGTSSVFYSRLVFDTEHKIILSSCGVPTIYLIKVEELGLQLFGGLPGIINKTGCLIMGTRPHIYEIKWKLACA